jgi:hypothetical protein
MSRFSVYIAAILRARSSSFWTSRRPSLSVGRAGNWSVPLVGRHIPEGHLLYLTFAVCVKLDVEISNGIPQGAHEPPQGRLTVAAPQL